MSLQEEELVSSHAGQPEQASSLLDQIMAQTRIQPGSEGYDVARQGVTAFIASILQSTASAEPVNKLVVDSMIADIDDIHQPPDGCHHPCACLSAGRVVLALTENHGGSR